MRFDELQWGPWQRMYSTTRRRVSQPIRSRAGAWFRIVEDESRGFVVRAGDSYSRVDTGRRIWGGFKADVADIACFILNLTPEGNDGMDQGANAREQHRRGGR
jgi:hypothetical protein